MRAQIKRSTKSSTPREAQPECNGGCSGGKGEFHSLKTGKIITYNSQIERDFLYLLDYDAAVRTFRHKPFTIEIPAPDQHGAKARWEDDIWVRYAPDFAVDILPPLPAQPYDPAKRRSRRASECAGERALLVEVLSSAQAATPAARQLFDTLTSWCRERTYGLEFCYLTDRQIRAGCYLENVKLLRQFAHHIIQPNTRALIHTLLEANPGGVPVGELAQAIDSLALDDATGCILHMAYQHEVAMPLADWQLSSQSLAYSPYHWQSPISANPLAHLLRKEG